MKLLKVIIFICGTILLSCSSDKDDNLSPNLVIKFKFDQNQERLNNFGLPSVIPPGNAGQSPNVNRMSANYIEFAPTALTALGAGEIIYEGPETTAGGEIAIDFQNANFAGDNESFLSIPLSTVNAGIYEWVRISLAYQEGEIDLLVDGNNITGNLSSFVGYNNYITTYDLNGSPIEVNGNRLQGFWAFEALGFSTQGQAPEGATTVPNPLFAVSPIPQGSCVVTGEFENGLVITGNQTEDVIVTLSFSINHSFEWVDLNPDGQYEPGAGEQVVDMGLRGLIPMIEY